MQQFLGPNNNILTWPYAFEQSPGCTSGVAPLEIFTVVAFDSFAHLQCNHVWGCPVYVLDPKLQDHKNCQNGKLELIPWHFARTL